MKKSIKIDLQNPRNVYPHLKGSHFPVEKIGMIRKFRFSWVPILCLFCALTANAQINAKQDNYMFRNLSESLSSNRILSICRDSRGFLWIGTDYGLNRYDSYHIQKYHDYSADLRGNRIEEIFEDNEGDVWLRTDKGFSVYDSESGKFNSNIQTRLQEYGIACNPSEVGVSSDKKYFWCYESGKIYLYDYGNKVTRGYSLKDSGLSGVYLTHEEIYTISGQGNLYSISIASSQINPIDIPEVYKKRIRNFAPEVYVDSNSGIWIHTFFNSLILYKKSLSDDWKEIVLPEHNEPFNRIWKISEDLAGNIWLITSHLGAYIYNPGSEHFVMIRHHPQKPHSIASNHLSALHIDRDGIVWIGNFKHGISYYIPQKQAILSYKPYDYTDIFNFHEDEKYLWHGTDGGGLIRCSLKDNQETRIPIPANVIDVLKVDSKGRMWLGCYQNGLFCYDQGKITQYTTENSDLAGNVYGLQEDDEGYIWIGTLDGVIQKFNPEQRAFETIYRPQGYLSIKELLYTGNNQLYIASSSGLIKVNTQTHTYSFFYNHQDSTKVLGQMGIYTLYKDSRNYLWVGHDHGLAYWKPGTEKVVMINHNNGLPSDFVKAIIEDNNQQMWIGTINGMARINLAQDPFSVVNYSTEDGLISNDINDRAMYKRRNGNILIGTPNGFMEIVPQEIIRSEFNARISLTNILSPRHDLSISDFTDNKSPEYANKLTLKEGRSFVQLHFSTLDFAESDKIQYAYRINGLNSEWVNMSNYQIDLSTLSAGDYELQIKARNAEGVWSTHTKHLTIKILPPWYKTRLAYGIYTALILLFIWNIISFFRFKRKRAAQIREIEQENERQKKLTDMKMQFFANVSHEFRTPLSLIINPLEEFISQNPQGKNSLIHTVLQNARYLLELIKQLLDFRKLDANGEVINYMHGDIVSIVKDQFLAFGNLAKKKNIDYQFICDNEILMDFDFDKVRKITTNILSNAFKYTNDGDSIRVKIDKSEDQVILQFSDTGCGIATDQQEKIFQCFYRPDLKDFSKEGTGIGLYLVSEYVKMHKGKIRLESNEPHGSIFTIILPLYSSIVIKTELSDKDKDEVEVNHKKEKDQCQQNYAILLVDDNQEFVDFLSASLSAHYKVFKAMNGLEALELLNAENVDIVISDVMMPKMDGLELCSAIKSNILFSHIPVILLTAKASEEYQMDGLHTGADEYIVKPFNMEILKLHINKLIKNDMDRRSLFDQQVNIEPNKITITSLDTQFIEKAITIVEDNFGNANFSVDELSEHLSISRGYLYKKLTKITGKTPIEFIRIMRIKRAQQLLKESQMSISEIAYLLGYNSPKIFTKHFKQEYKMTPSEYIHRITHQK